jgi:hypothetical protein
VRAFVLPGVLALRMEAAGADSSLPTTQLIKGAVQ